MKSGELEAALMEAGVPCALVNNFEEVFAHPQIVARGVVQEIEHPRLGTMKVTRNPVLLDHGGPDIARPAPMLGEHSEEILRQLGYSTSAIGQLASGGGDQARGAAAAESHGGGLTGNAIEASGVVPRTSWEMTDGTYQDRQSPRQVAKPRSGQREVSRRPTRTPIRPATAKAEGDKLQHAVDEAATPPRRRS